VSKLVRFPNLREARQEASHWVVRVDRGLSPEESASLRSWAASPLNKRALREMAGLWSDMSVLRALSDMFPLDGPSPGERTRPLRWIAVGVAASLAAIFAVALLVPGVHGLPGVHLSAGVPVEHLATPVGESRTVSLRDGSDVVLNTDTEVAVTFSGGHRDLHLSRGEAHFRVAHDAHSPFRVFVGGRTVQAVGTAFSVRLREGGGVDVLVTDGKVRVEDENAEGRGAARFVAAREMLSLDEAGQGTVLPLAPAEVEQRLAWQRGMLVFQGEPLAEVLREFRRYTSQELALADPALAALRVGGYFRAGDVDALLIALRQNFHIVSSRDERGRIVLSAAP